MNQKEEEELLEELHNGKKKDLSILNKKNLSNDELDELFAEI